MKLKLITLLTILVLVLSGCSSENTAETVSPEASSEEMSTENPNETEFTTETQTTEETPNTADVIFEEMTVVDNDYCTIRITSIDPDALWGYTLTTYLENKSADTTYMFSVQNAAINGVQCDPLFATEVTPSKKENTEISFPDTFFQDTGITECTDIELSFRVYDSNDWLADPVAEETVHIYPLGEENVSVFTREPQSSDITLVDNDYVTAIVTGFEDDPIWGYTVNLFLVNKTDTDVMFSVENASINGYMADPFYAASVSGQKCAFSSMSWSDTTLEESGITEITDIEFLFDAYDANDILADKFFNETITLNP